MKNFDPLLLQGLPYKNGEVNYRKLTLYKNIIRFYDALVLACFALGIFSIPFESNPLQEYISTTETLSLCAFSLYIILSMVYIYLWSKVKIAYDTQKPLIVCDFNHREMGDKFWLNRFYGDYAISLESLIVVPENQLCWNNNKWEENNKSKGIWIARITRKDKTIYLHPIANERNAWFGLSNLQELYNYLSKKLDIDIIRQTEKPFLFYYKFKGEAMNYKAPNQSVCVSSDHLTIDEYGDEGYNCIIPAKIITNTDTQNIKDNLFYAVGRMDATLSTIVSQIAKHKRIGVIFAIKDGGKSMAMNISNNKLNKNEIIALGMIEIEIGIIFLIPSGIAWAVGGLLISSLIAYFLSDLYLYLKDESIELWEKIKIEFDSATAHIASLIEENISSLQDFTSNIIHKVSSWIDEFDVNNLIIQGNHSNKKIEYNPAHPYANPQRNLSSQDYQSLIELLLNKDSNALDIDSLLHTFLNYLSHPTHSAEDSTNSSLALSTPKDALPIHIKAQCFNHKNEALSNREIYVYSPNFYSFVDRAKSDENGFIEFHNAYVSSKMTNSDVYFALNRYGRTGQ